MTFIELQAYVNKLTPEQTKNVLIGALANTIIEASIDTEKELITFLENECQSSVDTMQEADNDEALDQDSDE